VPGDPLFGDGCRNHFFRVFLSSDKYGFHVLALTLDPSNTLGASNPFAVSGYYEFHGDGTLNGADTVSRNGDIIPRTYTGTYQVNSDGTGTLTLDIFRPSSRWETS
jgi:hypothetical protein